MCFSFIWLESFVVELSYCHHKIPGTSRACRDCYWHYYTDNLQITHLLLAKMAAISQTTFSKTISWMKSFIFRFEFHWSLFLRVQLTIFRHWFRWWLGADQATSHYLNQCWPSSLTHIHVCCTRGRWVKPNDYHSFKDLKSACTRSSKELHWLD